MAETKRIELTNVGALKKDKKLKETIPTNRFNLTLTESNDKTCPEFNYGELQKSVTGCDIKNGADDGDPFSDNDGEDEKLKALARKFEEKYAPKAGIRNKMGHLEDYIDLGMGYDESDPFIDNTDAYDELVPSTLTTQYGGFYINSGKLDFKDVNSDSSDDGIIDMARRKKRHRLSELEKDASRKRRINMNDGEHINAMRKRGRKQTDHHPSINDGALNKPKKKQETVAVLLQQRKAQQHQDYPTADTPPVVVVSVATAPQSKTSSLQQFRNLSTVEASSDNEKKLSASVNEIIESVIITSRERDFNGQDLASVATVASVSSDSDNPPSVAAAENEVVPKLPDSLPETLDEVIKQIKVAAQKSGGGKCRFFSNEVNNMLLNIELMSRQLPCSQRSVLFAHLASHLPCTKETLMKRAKKLRLDQENGKLQDLLRQLRTAIYEVMPRLQDDYKAKCDAASQGITQVDDSSESDECYSTDDGSSGTEEEKLGQAVSGIMVKRKFVWNDKMRMLLCDIVQIKMKCFELMKTRTQSAEEYLKQFLNDHVKVLWPHGWMHCKKLMKESRLVHAHLTYRPKQNVILPKKSTSTQLVSVPGSLLPKCEPNFETSVGCANVQKAFSSVLTVPSQSPGTSASPRETPPPVRTVSPAIVTSGYHSVVGGGVTVSSVSATRPVSSPAQEACMSIPVTIQSPITESPSKLSGHVFSLLDPSLIKNALPESVSTSTAKDFLSEIISGALANFPNSSTVSKHSTSRDKFHESSLYTSAMNKCLSTATTVSSRCAFRPSSDVDSKSGFSVPKSSTKAPSVLTGSKSDSHLGGVSILKDHERHSTVSQHWSNRSSLQDVRTSIVKSSMVHGASNSGSSFKKSTSPLKLDMYVSASDCNSLPAKMSSAVSAAPYHSTFDIQRAIERGLKAQSSLVNSVCSPSYGSHSNHVSSKMARSVLVSSHQPSTSTCYSADLPLNFSTPRSSDRSPSGHSSRSASSSRSDRTTHGSLAPSVRTVMLPQVKSSKHASSSSHRIRRDTQDYLEGIAATFHEQHLKKSHRNNTLDYTASQQHGRHGSDAVSGGTTTDASQARRPTSPQVIRNSCATVRGYPS